MAVYTKISKKDISYINRKFDIEKILEFKGIKQGIVIYESLGDRRLQGIARCLSARSAAPD